MRTFKTILISGIVILSLALNGCTLFPNNKTRPAPVRPRVTVRPTPVGPRATIRPAPVRPGATPSLKIRNPLKTPASAIKKQMRISPKKTGMKLKTPMIKTTPTKK